eukprot:Gb_06675 [translate_table: standard]
MELRSTTRTRKKSLRSNRACKDYETTGSVLLPGLPNEIAMDCLARLPRLMHQCLQLVCKPWGNLFSSPDFYPVPHEQGLSNEWIYVHLELPRYCYKFYAWNLEKRVCLALPHFPSVVIPCAFTVAGGKLYSIGGILPSDDEERADGSNQVWAYDPCFNRWDSLPPMKIPRQKPAVGTIGGKIYVLGGWACERLGNKTDWAEMYDPALNVWTSMPVLRERKWNFSHRRDCAVLNEKLYVLHWHWGIIFDSTSSSLTPVPAFNGCSVMTKTFFQTWKMARAKTNTAVVKGLLFGYLDGKIRGYDFEQDEWLVLQGTGKLLQEKLCKATFVNVGDKLCVIRQNGSEMIFACLDIHKNPGSLCCDVLWCHSVISPWQRWSIDECVSLG